MATAKVNGVRLFYELSGTGEVPLVLVHGSWDSHDDWQLVVPRLADSFRVLTYDRRGHSKSERPTGRGSVREDVVDLAALIEQLGLEPAWVAGNSFGASIALRLAGERPELFRGLIGHEPPLFSLLGDDPTLAPLREEVDQRIAAVIERIASGDHAGAAEQFVETVALGPGTWVQMPPELQQTLIENAPTFLDEANDPEQLAFDLEWIRGFSQPALLTRGDQSPPTFAPVVAKLAGALPRVEVLTFAGAGHIPRDKPRRVRQGDHRFHAQALGLMRQEAKEHNEQTDPNHAYYQGHVGIYDIGKIERLAGSLPRRQDRLVLAWAELHQEELLLNWQTLQQGRPPIKIEPLK
jgi:pimeloyl-ACP methyl ester carboxylesterase